MLDIDTQIDEARVMAHIRSYRKGSGKRDEEGMPPRDWRMVNVTSNAKATDFGKGLSPMLLGPVELYDGFVSQTVEAAWQHSKVYPQHLTAEGNPTEGWWKWAKNGWDKTFEEYLATDKAALRYPLGKDPVTGKGFRPAYTYWQGQKLSYVEARREVYIPLYQEAALKSNAWKQLVELYHQQREKGSGVNLFDFDGRNLYNVYPDVPREKAYEMALNDQRYLFGHSQVLCAMLEEIDLTVLQISEENRYRE